MKNRRLQSLFTLMLLIFISLGKVDAQGTAAPAHNCGVFQKLGGIPDGFGGQVYYDRFGNAWSEDEIADLASNVNGDCPAGVFDLQFSGDYTQDEKEAVCAALSYLSGVVGGGAPNGVVPLKIEFKNGVGGAAASSFMQLECGVMKNFALVNIRTKTNQLPLNFFAGKIEVDQGINWYTGAFVPPRSTRLEHRSRLCWQSRPLHSNTT